MTSPSGGSVLILFTEIQSPEGPVETEQIISAWAVVKTLRPWVNGTEVRVCLKWALQQVLIFPQVFFLFLKYKKTKRTFKSNWLQEATKQVVTWCKRHSRISWKLKSKNGRYLTFYIMRLHFFCLEFVWGSYLLHSRPVDSHTHLLIWRIK